MRGTVDAAKLQGLYHKPMEEPFFHPGTCIIRTEPLLGFESREHALNQ